MNRRWRGYPRRSRIIPNMMLLFTSNAKDIVRIARAGNLREGLRGTTIGNCQVNCMPGLQCHIDLEPVPMPPRAVSCGRRVQMVGGRSRGDTRLLALILARYLCTVSTFQDEVGNKCSIAAVDRMFEAKNNCDHAQVSRIVPWDRHSLVVPCAQTQYIPRLVHHC